MEWENLEKVLTRLIHKKNEMSMICFTLETDLKFL